MTPRAPELLHSGIVWDNHGCLPLRADDRYLPQLERYRAAGVNVVSLNIGFADMSWDEHVRVVEFMRQWIDAHHGAYRLIRRVEDIVGCKKDGKLGIVFDVEGMGPVQDDPGRVRTLYDLGVRWMLIAYNRNNRAGGGCMDTDTGLTALGRAIIDQMESVGMVLCLSHAGTRTVRDALEYSKNPTIFSHSNPHGDTPHARNVSNELMRACADKGGVIGLSGIGPFLGGNSDVVSHLLRQLRYVIDQVGPGHVGLGLDYVFDTTELDEYVQNNPSLFPPGVEGSGKMGMVGPEAMTDIAEGLARDNLTDSQIREILGENWLRIATRVWR